MRQIGEPIEIGAGVQETIRKPMVTKLTDRIVEMLRSCPYGLTAKEVASRLGATASNISSRLSKLAAYGIIIKTRGRIARDASPCAIYNAPLAAAGAPLLRPPK
jgi:predicted transcriptional regulator